MKRIGRLLTATQFRNGLPTPNSGYLFIGGLYSVPAWGPLPSDGAGLGECFSEWYWWRLMDKRNKVNPLFTAFHNRNYGENFKYQDFVKDFTCEMFKPDEWAKLFREAGARYMVLTSKHHDGFALWNSVHSWNWNAVDVGPWRRFCLIILFHS